MIAVGGMYLGTVEDRQVPCQHCGNAYSTRLLFPAIMETRPSVGDPLPEYRGCDACIASALLHQTCTIAPWANALTLEEIASERRRCFSTRWSAFVGSFKALFRSVGVQ